MNNKTIELLEEAISRRRDLRCHTNALRLVNGYGDGLAGLIIEQYDRHFVLQISDKRWFTEKDILTSFIRDRLQGIYLVVKDRTASVSATPDAIKVSVWINHSTSKTIVQENGLRFEVDLNDGLNSGLFLDMRHNRKIVAQMAMNRRVLNCFSYTCSFGVYCRAAGAKGLVNVDISRKSLERGKLSYELNQLIPAYNEFIRNDTLSYLARAIKKKNCFDLIILDPPSFSRHENKTFSVKKDLKALVKSATEILSPGGALFLSTNFSELSCDDLEGEVRDASGIRRIKDIQHLGQDEDFIVNGFSLESYLAAVLVEMC
ncbi:MAG: class I SAM-dependent methyltransferase [Candidatus Omnitrophica bacterium]|nr:class I SAM-dependent methyltransferase [Candidatus Omnitrophota bacterium]